MKNVSFKNEVNKIADGKGNYSQMIMATKQSPYWMTQLGYKKYPIFIGSGHIASALNINGNNRNKHQIDIATLIALPKLLKKPIFVCKSYLNRIEIYLNAADNNGKIIIVCLQPETSNKIFNSYVISKLHYISSIYGKDHSLSIVNNSIKTNGMLYPFNKTKNDIIKEIINIQRLSNNISKQ